MHLRSTVPDSPSVIVKLNIGVGSEQGHGYRAIHDLFPDHQGGKPLSERVVMYAGLPDRDLFSLPRLYRSYRYRPSWNPRDHAPSTGPRSEPWFDTGRGDVQ